MADSTIEPALKARLKRMHLRAELPDEDTLSIRRVPANLKSFNKAATNLLIKRAAAGMPCLVCVDEDLDYCGTDQALAQAFAASPTQQGWRILAAGGSPHGDLSSALDYALTMLGTEEEMTGAVSGPARTNAGVLAARSRNLTDEAARGVEGVTLFRDEAIEQAATCVLGWQGRLPLILGEAGTGKTNLLHGVAALLAKRQKRVLSVNMATLTAGTLFESEREALLVSILREAQESGAVLALEQAEWAITGVPRGVAILRDALDNGARLIACSVENHESLFAAHPLGSRLEIIRLTELCRSDACRVLKQLREVIGKHHAVEIHSDVVETAVERSLSMPGSLPGKSIKLLDAAAARASLTGAPSVTVLDVYLVASRLLGESV